MKRIMLGLILFVSCQSNHDAEYKLNSTKTDSATNYQSDFRYFYSKVTDTTLIFSTIRDDWANRAEIHQYPGTSGENLFSLSIVDVKQNKIDFSLLRPSLFLKLGYVFNHFTNPKLRFSNNGTITLIDSLAVTKHYMKQITLENNETVITQCSADTILFDSTTYNIDFLGKIHQNQ